jgi:hypothetical protein
MCGPTLLCYGSKQEEDAKIQCVDMMKHVKKYLNIKGSDYKISVHQFLPFQTEYRLNICVRCPKTFENIGTTGEQSILIQL